MYTDLFEQLGGGAGGVGGRRGGASDSVRAAQAPPPLVSCKAGKMVLEAREGDNAKKYWCTPDTKRGEIRLVYKDAALQWQWYDRRDQKVVDTHALLEPSGTFTRVPLAGKKHERDRVYVWHKGSTGTDNVEMYWMQDESEEKEDETVAQINKYLADPALAAPPAAAETAATSGSSSGSASATLGAAAASSTSSATGASGNNNNNNNNNQVDALSSILENLGMPQSGGAAAATGTLTMADLQNAMTGMQQQQQSTTVVPLTEIVTPAAITALLEQNDDVKQRLLELLPAGQRTEADLADNLRSPQVQQTLRTLTQALLPDDAGNMEGFYSVLANFQLPTPSNVAATHANPIAAFLQAIQESVDSDNTAEGEEAKEGEEAAKDDTKEEDGDEKMEEEKQGDS